MSKALLFISGLLSNEEIWSHQIKSLSDRALIKVISPTQDSPQKMVEEILRQAPSQFALAGHSMGGWLCLEVMKKAKERVTKLCLLNTTAKPDTPLKKTKRKEMIQRAESGQFLELAKELVDYFVFNPSVKYEVEKMFLKVGEQAFIRQERSMLIRDECESILPKIQCPTLIIHAAKDNVFTLEDHQELANNIPKAKLAILQDCGHMSPLEMPRKVSSLLGSWISRVEELAPLTKKIFNI